ncbi:hypothetical protein [Mycobacteroides abscessus]|uniref:hypothetical protein n=1 Tax=Mycobacteroides abscessus TaxID=36809 RepID=UPI000B32EA1E|nr:hypothetical protein [Mycobacteroides abscessus]
MTVEPGEVLKHLHRARLSHYRGAGGSDADALALYEWNIELTSALQELLGIAEVAVRHAIDVELRSWSVTHCGTEEWIDHVSALPYLSVAEVFSTTRHRLYGAADLSQKERVHGHPRRGHAPNHDDLVAHIMFGTWARMLPEKFDARWVDGRGTRFRISATCKRAAIYGVSAYIAGSQRNERPERLWHREQSSRPAETP